jgi:diphthine-ammonia ligase
MKAFVSWSGGKDCMLALHRFRVQNPNAEITLINMCNADGEHSSSHGIKKSLIQKQAECIGFSLIQEGTDFQGYEKKFKEVISVLKQQQVDTGIFGDIYLMEHRTWIERVCAEMQIQPIFPLWGCNTKELLQEFIIAGFKTLTVAVNSTFLDDSWPGRTIDADFLEEISKLKGIDACAENGEYHSFVFDGPLFTQPVLFEKGEVYKRDGHWFLELK